MSDSFIHELLLHINPEQESTLEVRFAAACQLYNGCLGEALKRLKLARESRAWQKAQKLSKSKERTELFKRALKYSKFSEYELHVFVKKLVRESSIKDHIDSQVAQKIASRAFKAVDEYLVGKRGNPRFKRPSQFSSLEGKSNITGIRFKNGKIFWQNLILKPIYDLEDKDGVEAHALSQRTKYVRLVRRKIRGKTRYFAQLIQEGKPLVKKKHGITQNTVGLDIGPSSIAIVSHQEADLITFASTLEENHKPIKKLQRALDRSRRATNPNNYNEKGVPLKNAHWNRSHRYTQKQQKLAEKKRVFAATRKTHHGHLANQILSLGNIIKTEKLSYKSFQINFGRSATKYAPGMLLQILRRKAENADGQVIEFSTYKTKLSQTCHACGETKKKPLSLRTHKCNCGIGPIQRDLYSAFLALHVENGQLDRAKAQKAWSSADSLLRQTLSRKEETTRDKQRLVRSGLNQRQSCSPAEDGSTTCEIKDVVQEDTVP